MDDIIYILIAIAWVAFSVYNANQKRKQKAAKNQQARQPSPEEPRKRSILEEILMEDETPSYEPEEITEQELATVSEYQAALDYQKELLQRIEAIDQKYSMAAASDTSQTHGQDEESRVITRQAEKSFDLQQAVIYTAILERPYR